MSAATRAARGALVGVVAAAAVLFLNSGTLLADDGARLPYSGVHLRGGKHPWPAVSPPRDGTQYVIWPGFRPETKAAGASVFLELTGAVSYKLRKYRGGVEIILNKARAYRRNNYRRVVTRHFPGPIKSFRLRRLKHRRLRLRINLRQRLTPSVQMISRGRYHYLVIRFPRSAS